MSWLLKEKAKLSQRPRKKNQNWSKLLEKKLKRKKKLWQQSLRPVLDLEKSIIKKLIKQGKKDGYLTNELIRKSFPEIYERIKEVKTGNKVLELPTINTLPIDVLIIPKSLLIWTAFLNFSSFKNILYLIYMN